MKKLLMILVMVLWCSVGLADSPILDDDYDENSLNNNLTEHRWKIDSVKQVRIDNERRPSFKEVFDIYILKKGSWILYCKIGISDYVTVCTPP